MTSYDSNYFAVIICVEEKVAQCHLQVKTILEDFKFKTILTLPTACIIFQRKR